MAIEIKRIAETAGTEISKIQASIPDNEIEKLINKIEKANKIFVAGAGRSLLMLRAFALRLMHLGFDSYVVGDTITPAFEPGDVLVIGSASGETGNLIEIAKKAKKIGGDLVVLSIFPESTLGKMADGFLRIPAYTDKLPESKENKKNVLPGGSMFEISMLVLLDSMIIPLGNIRMWLRINISIDTQILSRRFL
ncbi:6-phospho-3-hexuloisomerase [Lacticaseibacillus paracasei]|uniref:6-phospho-3-hexuloisomerase n=1 Tax=Lacticaseibacillus paracasei TaxID=1597 RepID=UPI001E2F367A|nr:6-phospho-3-hexuloisomerase [Lacticaseibacillus paracasei]